MAPKEDELIALIRRRIPSAAGGMLRLGIGDDAAVLRAAPRTELVVSTDQFLEQAHFLPDVHPPDAVGYKALARAASDLGAMGARPSVFFLSLGLPAQRTGRWLNAMLAGMARAARIFGLRLAGGDTARSATISMAIAVVGEVPRGQAVRRSGAKAGDAIFVTGTLGAAELGLQIVLKGLHRERALRPLLRPHYYPVPPLRLGRWLAERRLASSMMDLSDGLSTDLSRLCKASSMGARLEEEALPLVAVPGDLRKRGFDDRAMALHGGEDYSLLFTVPRRLIANVPRTFQGVPIAQIGRIVHGRAITLVSATGRTSRLKPSGWDHFD